RERGQLGAELRILPAQAVERILDLQQLVVVGGLGAHEVRMKGLGRRIDPNSSFIRNLTLSVAAAKPAPILRAFLAPGPRGFVEIMSAAPVAIIMGSRSDWPVLRHAAELLE